MSIVVEPEEEVAIVFGIDLDMSIDVSSRIPRGMIFHLPGMHLQQLTLRLAR